MYNDSLYKTYIYIVEIYLRVFKYAQELRILALDMTTALPQD